MEWFAVRSLLRHQFAASSDTYEERITLWCADTPDSALALAEDEAREHASILSTADSPTEYVDFGQCYHLADPLGHGAEVFSLMRDSDLEPEDYRAWFFETGGERQMPQEDDESLS